MPTLSDEVSKLIATGWSINDDGALTKEFVFDSFMLAFAWMIGVALVAERENHHPEWSNVYNRVSVVLRTHDENNAITSKDTMMAKEMDQRYAE